MTGLRDIGIQCSGVGVENDYKCIVGPNELHEFDDILKPAEWEQLPMSKDGVGMPRMHDIVVVSSSFVTSDRTVQIVFEKGLQGKVIKIDSDGCIKVLFPSLLTGD